MSLCMWSKGESHDDKRAPIRIVASCMPLPPPTPRSGGRRRWFACPGVAAGGRGSAGQCCCGRNECCGGVDGRSATQSAGSEVEPLPCQGEKRHLAVHERRTQPGRYVGL